MFRLFSLGLLPTLQVHMYMRVGLYIWVIYIYFKHIGVCVWVMVLWQRKIRKKECSNEWVGMGPSGRAWERTNMTLSAFSSFLCDAPIRAYSHQFFCFSLLPLSQLHYKQPTCLLLETQLAVGSPATPPSSNYFPSSSFLISSFSHLTLNFQY